MGRISLRSVSTLLVLWLVRGGLIGKLGLPIPSAGKIEPSKLKLLLKLTTRVNLLASGNMGWSVEKRHLVMLIVMSRGVRMRDCGCVISQRRGFVAVKLR